jgi:hypothetical protein
MELQEIERAHPDVFEALLRELADVIGGIGVLEPQIVSGRPLCVLRQGFYKTASQQGLVEARLSNYQEKIREVSSRSAAEVKRLDQALAVFRQHGKQHSFDPMMLDRTLFTFASFKSGPDNIARIRTEAAKRGLDPDQWLNNVELVAAEKIGLETTAYVRNILKYEVANQMLAGRGRGRRSSGSSRQFTSASFNDRLASPVAIRAR